MSLLKYFTSSTGARQGDSTRQEPGTSEQRPGEAEDSMDSDQEEPMAKQARVSCDDPDDVANASTSTPDYGKHQLLKNHFKPGPNYKFPKGVQGRTFQYKWLQAYPWLVYSKKENGGYCLPCVLFASSGYQSSTPGILATRPLIAFAKALETLRNHANKDYHKTAVIRAEEFLKVMENQQPGISHRISQTVADTVKKNRKILSSIIKTIVLCGQQNISLRGHRDSFADVEKTSSLIPQNHGNFWALLHFRVDSGDTTLGDHLATASHNASYTSGNIQNQLIDIIGSQIRGKILERVKKSGWFSVIADEVTDVSNKALLSIVLRYVNPDTVEIREDFVGFVECDTEVTGRCLADKILGFLTALQLDQKMLRGQGYDGAGSMAGSVNGTAALISAQYPLALYFHCASHCLNLAVVKSLEVTNVRNMMGIVGKVHDFFESHPKRQTALNRAIEEHQSELNVSKLKDLCRTRWVERIDALQVFKNLYPSVVICFESITDQGLQKWSSDAVLDASSFKNSITTSEFLSALVITNACLKYIQALTKSLQAEAQDIISAVSEIGSVIDVLKAVREKIDQHHSEWFLEVERMCIAVGVRPSQPRICSHQTRRDNVPAESPSIYFKRCISIPLLDHLLSQLNSRFSSHQQSSLLGMYLVPSMLVTLTDEECGVKFDQLLKLYQVDLPSPDCALEEIHCWWMKWNQSLANHGHTSLPKTLAQTLQHISSMYPNIKVLISILSTLPVTSCSAERSFSSLKQTKTSLRSSMGTERLTGLSLLHLHFDIPTNIDHVVDEFARRHPRRIQLANILAD